MTDHQALFLAWKLSARAVGASFDRIAGSLGSASVDLNPHQIEAALFALQSPLARGALLADEVGLGKTIEAGIVIAQLWAEGRRKVLLIVPASIRKQWVAELQEKFGLRAAILDSLTFQAHLASGCENPFIADETILVVSYQFAAGKGAELAEASFDLVLFDEAHRLRNVFKRKNKISQRLRSVLSGTNKLLLTATPLQNSLLELYGLMTFVDPLVFGSERSFRERFVNSNDPARFEELKRRIQPHCCRTLRRQVSEYIRYTKRGCLTELFEPYEDEAILYEMVSSWLSAKHLNSFPNGHKGLVSLIIRKVMASSSFALSGTFDRLLRRLEEQKRRGLSEDDLMTELEGDLDELRSGYEDWDEEGSGSDEDGPSLEEELAILQDLRARALAITRNAKGDRLAAALSRGFVGDREAGSPKEGPHLHGEPEDSALPLRRPGELALPGFRCALQRPE
ncbi:MAG: DEAD/DEAH box helicase [Candidatus Moduliflexus flocculans]|nr:DEAD/DEAH box helicase [Candidatus Moduliflexus flocculans]